MEEKQVKELSLKLAESDKLEAREESIMHRDIPDEKEAKAKDEKDQKPSKKREEKAVGSSQSTEDKKEVPKKKKKQTTMMRRVELRARDPARYERVMTGTCTMDDDLTEEEVMLSLPASVLDVPNDSDEDSGSEVPKKMRKKMTDMMRREELRARDPDRYTRIMTGTCTLDDDLTEEEVMLSFLPDLDVPSDSDEDSGS